MLGDMSHESNEHLFYGFTSTYGFGFMHRVVDRADLMLYLFQGSSVLPRPLSLEIKREER